MIHVEKKKYTQLVMKIIEAGIAQGVFKPVDPRLQAYAILGMCNWIYKWYKPDKEVFAPEQIAAQFIALLESGYLADQHQEGRLDSPPSTGNRPKMDSAVEKQTLQELKLLSEQLSSLVDKLGR
jgi:hypothetical protein